MGEGGSQKLIWQRAGRSWSTEARLLGAYLVSGPQSNRIGCFWLDRDKAALETGLPVATVDALLEQFGREGFVRDDAACGWVWIPEVLQNQPFTSTDEVRRAMPELGAVPREFAFHAELVRAFRISADRPGPIPAGSDPRWLAGLVGDAPAAELAQRWTAGMESWRQALPGAPSLNAETLHKAAEKAVTVREYTRDCRAYFSVLVNTRPLRILALLTVIGAVLFVVFPGIDLGVARWFFEPPRSFKLGETWMGRFFDNEVHFAMEWFLPVLVGGFLYGQFRGRPVFGLTPRKFLFVALSIALGAGLLTNVVLKDSWGRARPSQVEEFGGAKNFTPPFMRSTQCAKNCSFVSGDASLAASFMSFAVIADRNRRRWWLGLGTFTAVVGVMRMARGSHFLSDVVFAVLFTLMIMLVLKRLILEDRWRDWPRWRRGTGPGTAAGEGARA